MPPTPVTAVSGCTILFAGTYDVSFGTSIWMKKLLGVMTLREADYHFQDLSNLLTKKPATWVGEWGVL